MLPSISIIVPVLNEADLIVDALMALHRMQKSFPEEILEIIVVDGGSDDGSAGLAGDYADRVLQSRRGRALQMSVGANAARGNVLLFMHIDTVLSAEAMQALLRQLVSVHDEHLWGFFAARLSLDKGLLWWVGRFMSLRSRLTSIATGDQCLFVSRQLFDCTGGLPQQPLMEDVELTTKLKRVKKPVVVTEPVVTSSRRWQLAGPWSTIFHMWALRFDYWRGVGAEEVALRYYPSWSPSRYAVALLSKLPELGRVKTRLIPLLGEHAATNLHQQMLQRSLSVLGNVPDVSRQLWVSGEGVVPANTERPLSLSCERLQSTVDECQIAVSEQVSGDLGQRMSSIVAQALETMDGVVLIGADCPAIDTYYIEQAMSALQQGNELVLGPALDGGYVLIALSTMQRSLFKDIDWGTDKVFEQTVRRAEQLGLRYHCLQALPDIDRPEDLSLLAQYGVSLPVGVAG